jgi:hypothetical protein
VAKRFGDKFRIFRLKPNHEGQQPCGKLRKADDAPLYFHSLVKRGYTLVIEKVYTANRKSGYNSVWRLGAEEMYRIQSGPMNSYEKTCVNLHTGDEVAFGSIITIRIKLMFSRMQGTLQTLVS